MFYFLCNYFTLQYINLYYINRYMTYKFGWKPEQIKRRLNQARGGIGAVRPLQQGQESILDFKSFGLLKHAIEKKNSEGEDTSY